MDEKEKGVIPPYVPYKTFRNFVDGLKPVPPVIDRSIMRTMGGALQGQLFAALRYLKLIDENGKTQESLKTLAQGKDQERQKILSQILHSGYPFLFNPVKGDFNLTNGTNNQFINQFQEQGASGDTVRKCGKFFLDAAKDAGITVSQYIQPTKISKPRTSSPKMTRPRSTVEKDSQQPRENNYNIGNVGGDSQVSSPWGITFKAAFDLLPEYGKAHWTSFEREKWIVLMTALIDAYIKVDDGNQRKQ
jgi:hypothetical protein